MANTLLDSAREYHLNGWSPIPIPFGQKKPALTGWQQFIIIEAELPAHFSGEKGNIGVLLGKPSAGLIDIDLDCDEALRIADVFLPKTDAIFGRRSKLRSHWLYRCKPIPNTKKYTDIDAKRMLAEQRSTGAQTIFPPSLHPSGERIQWDIYETPKAIDPATLEVAIRKLATAALLARHWPTGSRQDAVMALAGGLLRAGWSEDDVAEFIEAVANAANDEEADERVKVVAYTREKLNKKEEVTGWKTLATFIGKDVVNRVRNWLGSNREHTDNDHTETLTTNVIADAILKSEHFAQDAGGKLYVYEDGYYQPYGERCIKRRVKEKLAEWNLSDKWTTHRTAEVIEYICVDADDLWEIPPNNVVNVKNGLLNVKTRELKPHSPGHLSPIRLPIIYDPSAKCPAVDKFVEETFPENTQIVAFELLAFLMTPMTSHQTAVLLLGTGANGKSRYIAFVTAFIGHRNCANLSLHKLESDKFAAARLVGKLLNACPDIPSSHLASTSMFKAITGGDRITAERKYFDSFEFIPFARLLFSANSPPRSEDNSEGFFRRWAVIPFENTFEGEDAEPAEQLDARLAAPNELSGALNRALDVINDVRQYGISKTDKMQKAWDEFREMTDPVGIWLDHATQDGHYLRVGKAELVRAYNHHADRQSLPRLSSKAMTVVVKRSRPTAREKQMRINDVDTRVWEGIGLKQDVFQ